MISLHNDHYLYLSKLGKTIEKACNPEIQKLFPQYQEMDSKILNEVSPSSVSHLF